MVTESEGRSFEEILKYIEDNKLTFDYKEDALVVYAPIMNLPLVTYPNDGGSGFLREAVEFLMDMEEQHHLELKEMVNDTSILDGEDE